MRCSQAIKILRTGPLVFGDLMQIEAHRHLEDLAEALVALSQCDRDVSDHWNCPTCGGTGVCEPDCIGLCWVCGGSGIDCRCVFGLPAAAVAEALDHLEDHYV